MNEEFLSKMKSYLKEEYVEYLKTLEFPPFKGIRVNLLKSDIHDIKERLEIPLSETPFSKEGFYIQTEERLGKSIEHLQGLFYIQEPSATSAVEVLDVQKGDWVLDLCAAPGGKSTQIASKLKNSGFLISNDPNASRATILAANMERCGISNAMITNSLPEELCPKIQGWFDKVLVDAPCSGEGMFKKNDHAMLDWSQGHVEACAKRQLKILENAYLTLKKEGILVYSTCTYSMEENERVISEFLKSHPDMKQISCGVDFGREGFDYEFCKGSFVRRIFPMDQGEGHFIAKMIRQSDPFVSKKHVVSSKMEKEVKEFLKDQLSLDSFYLLEINGRYYLNSQPFLALDRIKILKEGILIGEMIKKRFEPNHHFYMSAYLAPYFKKKLELNHEECLSYLHGYPLNKECEKGYVALEYKGNMIGFGKSDGAVIKNKFPKGLRI